jgi:hypothetical protein
VQIDVLLGMRCPYCGGAFRVARAVSRSGDRLDYGLVECRCFAFPVVDGILLLSLAKGYGGAEEALQPLVPLQVAAVRFLGNDDVAGLRAWIRRHAPFAGDLIDGTQEPYLTFAGRLDRALQTQVDAFLDAAGRYEVVGTPLSRARWLAKRAAGAFERRRSSAEAEPPPTPADYYRVRYCSPRVNALALQMGFLHEPRRLLSLCCGHGVFENLVRARRQTPEVVVSLDAQFLNLLITRRYADHGGSYVCHDLQFPLPFIDGTFDGVFSSTCLPEIPAQRTFVAKAIRVTSDDGWTAFDSIWNAELGEQRISAVRYYRFCQNLFATLDDYVPFFEECAGPRRKVGVDVPAAPASYLGPSRWAFGEDVRRVLAERADDELSAIVVGPTFGRFTEAGAEWLRAEDTAASVAFDAVRRSDRIDLRRRSPFDVLHPAFAPRQFEGYARSATVDLRRIDDGDYLAGLFTSAVVNVVPRDFTADRSRLLRTAGPPAGAPTRHERGTNG